MDTSEGEEIRLALVMNGGVSLAVWMGGVTHEIDLLRRASDPDVMPTSVRSDDRRVFERWRQACDGSSGGQRRRVVVDIVAGTSAGGLNGTLLATAIARGAALDPAQDTSRKARKSDGSRLKSVWRDQASLEFGKLLPHPDAQPRPSILNSEHFADAVKSVIDGIEESDGVEERPITLFVTATSTCSGAAQNYADSFGNPLSCSDHRRIYRFERRDTYKYHEELAGSGSESAFKKVGVNDFAVKDDHPMALVSAARASASFPLAFAPVDESKPKKLSALRVKGVGGGEAEPPSWLIDGGILDNAPFGPVLQTIAGRELSGRVRRLLIYVVPSSGNVAVVPANEPRMPKWTEVLASATEFPREADLRADVEGIQSLLGQADGLWSDRTQFFGSLLATPDEPEARAVAEGKRAEANAAAATLLPFYCRARTASEIFEARRLVATTSLAPTKNINVDLMTSARWVPDANSADLAGTTDPWQWGVTGARQTMRLLLRDLRRRLEEDALADPERENLRQGLATLSREWIPRVEAVEERAAEELRSLLGGGENTDDERVAVYINAAQEILRLPVTLSWLVREAVAAYHRAVHPGLDEQDVLRQALNVEVISRAFHARSPVCPVAPFEFLRLGPDVESPLLGTDLNTRVMQKAEGKLYGTQFNHFGAFGDPSWREWDWVMGRLDAVAHLGKVLGMGVDGVKEMQSAVLTSEGIELGRLTEQLDIMTSNDAPGLIEGLKRLPKRRGRGLVRNVFESAAGGLRHLEHPPALRGPARFLARRRVARWLWLRSKGF
ncbi:DUF3376 domain-containing protein [Streptomyces sp. NPDC048723]|uniref:DUF3376 domain-containing protein n=1 Tax=Streptomyces sp. NPDC048723 TaxID=3365589 RepID=UPI003724B10C